MTARKKTAIHEAGHAVAFYRLCGDDGRYGGRLTIEPHEELLGSHSAEELLFPWHEEVTAADQQAFENEALYACAGYAAMVAVDCTEKDALAGCSCEQIIDMQKLGDGHTKHGCSISAMDDWVDVVNMP